MTNRKIWNIWKICTGSQYSNASIIICASWLTTCPRVVYLSICMSDMLIRLCRRVIARYTVAVTTWFRRRGLSLVKERSPSPLPRFRTHCLANSKLLSACTATFKRSLKHFYSALRTTLTDYVMRLRSISRRRTKSINVVLRSASHFRYQISFLRSTNRYTKKLCWLVLEWTTHSRSHAGVKTWF